MRTTSGSRYPVEPVLGDHVAIDVVKHLVTAVFVDLEVIDRKAGDRTPLAVGDLDVDLDHFDIDPAVATGVFITTTNDILGVLVYFTVASTIYLGAII